MMVLLLFLVLGGCRGCNVDTMESGDTQDDTCYSSQEWDTYLAQYCAFIESCLPTEPDPECVEKQRQEFADCTIHWCVIHDCLADGGLPTCEDTEEPPVPESCSQDWFDCPGR